MNYISNSMNHYFTRNSFTPSSTYHADFQQQPTIRSLPENNVDTGIDIHSIEYDFPLEKKVRAKAPDPISEPGVGTRNSTTAAEKIFGSAQMNASKPAYQDSVSIVSKNSKTSPTLEPVTTDNDEEVSGFSVNSFFDSIRFSDSFSLKLHIEHGFKGTQEFMVGTEKYNAFDYAMHCKNFSGLIALAPTVNPSNKRSPQDISVK